jgi:hypothetical protein
MNRALELLFGSWTGILSLFVILFMVGMAVFFVIMYLKLGNGSGT